MVFLGALLLISSENEMFFIQNLFDVMRGLFYFFIMLFPGEGEVSQAPYICLFRNELRLSLKLRKTREARGGARCKGQGLG